MESIKKILIPTNFSRYSNEAVTYGCNLAQAFGAEVILLHVLPKKEHISDEEFHETEKAMDLQLRLNLPTSVRTGVKVEKKILSGTPFDDILKTAGKEKVDMIVMGGHREKGYSHMFNGCLAEKMIRKSPCPLMAINESPRKEEEEEETFH